jgi:uncharacterized alkaline shock family protein YloU
MGEINRVDLGSVKIHKRVIAEIVCAAMKDIDGMDLISRNLAQGLQSWAGIPQYPGVSVRIDKNNQTSVEINVHVRYGLHIPHIAQHAQDVIRRALGKAVDIDVKDVNINVQGITKGDGEAFDQSEKEESP